MTRIESGALAPRRDFVGVADVVRSAVERSCKAFPGLRTAVTACGRLRLHRKRINISTVLAGQKLGIKEVDDGIWLVSFMHYDLGYFDLEQKTLQPIDNPFGPRLSPMS